MSEAKGGDDDRAEAKGTGASEAKGESKDGGEDAKGGGRRASVFEGLLKLVAEDADTKLFGGDADLMVWVADHASEWDDAVEGERTGSGSPMKKMSTYKSLHREYLDILESWLTNALERNNGSQDQFMREVAACLEKHSGIMVGPPTRDSSFVQTILAMDDFEEFHKLMMKHASLAALSPAPRPHK